ncbi:MAG: site-specific DNA-methyltransferase, partial [Saprospiraceae bacterium]|nr:site-specific DNA-methyltransferase [Saprospiraceae bacterium]
MKNRFNRLTSKEWLPFQKSWFKYSDDYTLYREHIRFFCKAEITEEVLYYYGLHGQIVQEICAQENIQFVENITDTSAIQYAFLDLRHEINPEWKIEEIQSYIKQVSNIIKTVNDALIDRRFVTILLPQSSSLEKPYVPIAWLLAYSISRFLHLKDEKIACLPDVHENLQPSFSDMRNSILYCLNFRKDEAQEIRELPFQYNKLYSNISEKKSAFPSKVLEKWFILKPNPRKKNEVLHPAKFPEELVVKYVEALTNVGDNVLDPMSGTGSTQVASVKLGRNGYGT